jgi:hypothetical protein
MQETRMIPQTQVNVYRTIRRHIWKDWFFIITAVKTSNPPRHSLFAKKVVRPMTLNKASRSAQQHRDAASGSPASDGLSSWNRLIYITKFCTRHHARFSHNWLYSAMGSVLRIGLMRLVRKAGKIKLTSVSEPSALMRIKTRVIRMFDLIVLKMDLRRNKFREFPRFCLVVSKITRFMEDVFWACEVCFIFLYIFRFKHSSPLQIFSELLSSWTETRVGLHVGTVSAIVVRF